MVKHKSTAINCPVILKSAYFQGVSETTLSALRRRISELDTALGCDVLNPYVYWVIAVTSSKIEYLSADLVKLLSQESAPVRKILGCDLRLQWQPWNARFQFQEFESPKK